MANTRNRWRRPRPRPRRAQAAGDAQGPSGRRNVAGAGLTGRRGRSVSPRGSAWSRRPVRLAADLGVVAIERGGVAVGDLLGGGGVAAAVGGE